MAFWQKKPWYKSSPLIGIFKLDRIRKNLQKNNLIDGYGETIDHKKYELARDRENTKDIGSTYRLNDGRCTDPVRPKMGKADSRFGRNMPFYPQEQYSNIPPKDIADLLLQRDKFIHANGLNVLAAAWIQFQVHEWFSHETEDDSYACPLEVGGHKTTNVSSSVSKSFPNGDRWFYNTETHWWDGSQIYGTSDEVIETLFPNNSAEFKLTDDDRLQEDTAKRRGRDITGFSKSYWVGLSILHTLFSREHNLIVEKLRAKYEGKLKSDGTIYTEDDFKGIARNINAALMAKVHTTEWSAGLLPHPTTHAALQAYWQGFLNTISFGKAREKHGLINGLWLVVLRYIVQVSYSATKILRIKSIHQRWKRIAHGMFGGPISHNGVPFSLTEEFVAVYRMHPLIPDTLRVRQTIPHKMEIGTINEIPFKDLAGEKTYESLSVYGFENCFLAMGQANAGAISLKNFPSSLRNLTDDDDKHLGKDAQNLDLAQIDILRDRERGLPRYNDFRKELGMDPVKSFEELNSEYAAILRKVYSAHEDEEKNLKDVDLMVGLFAENKPTAPGNSEEEMFAISDTAFRIFVLMAARRIHCDPFFTQAAQKPGHAYTDFGMEWIKSRTFRDIITDHYPRLVPYLPEDNGNPFGPWKQTPN